MDFGIKGKGALVMSSSRGLGFAIASALAAEGVNVVLTGRSEENLKINADAINARGQGQAFYKSADLMESDAMGPLVAFAREQLGQVDILINNTGGPPPGRMVDADQAAFAKHFNAMVLRVAEVTQLVLPEMRAASRATIPAGRYGTAEEFGAVAAFLASTQASYVTGTVTRCDGGSIKSV